MNTNPTQTITCLPSIKTDLDQTAYTQLISSITDWADANGIEWGMDPFELFIFLPLLTIRIDFEYETDPDHTYTRIHEIDISLTTQPTNQLERS